MSAGSACLALLRRELLGVLRSRSQLYSSVLVPLVILGVLGAGVSEGLEPQGLSDGGYAGYLLGGAVAMASVFAATFASASYYRDRDTGMLRAMLTSPHDPRVLLLGRSLGAVVLGTLQGLVVFAAGAPFVDLEWQYSVAGGVGIVVLVLVLFNLALAGIAQALASRISTMQGFHLLMNLVLFPLLFVSGAFFPVEGLPAWLEVLARVNPLAYAVDALHLAAYAGSDEEYFGLAVDFLVLAGLVLLTNLPGLARRPRLTWSGA